MTRKVLACRICGNPVLYGNLRCSAECDQIHSAYRDNTAFDLQQAGFSQDGESPNLFVKDGVAVTVEAVDHVGISQALVQHGHASGE